MSHETVTLVGDVGAYKTGPPGHPCVTDAGGSLWVRMGVA